MYVQVDDASLMAEKQENRSGCKVGWILGCAQKQMLKSPFFQLLFELWSLRIPDVSFDSYMQISNMHKF